METGTPDEQDLAKEQKLEEIRNKFKRTTDSLELEIDPGIFETVVILNALDFPTSQSCEGHLEEREGGHPLKAPWVEIYFEPKEKNWLEDEKLKAEVTQKNLQYQKRMIEYLDEFYQDYHPHFDSLINIERVGIYGGFRIQSNGTHLVEVLPSEEQKEKLKTYRQEMDRFTQFLKEKYFRKRSLDL